MRSFEERKEEILSRSRERVRKTRAVRTRIAALCIPVALTAAVLFLPKQSSNSTVPDAVTTAPTFAGEPEQALGTNCTITVSRGGQLLIHDDETAVDAILSSLEAICAREPLVKTENFVDDFQSESSSITGIWQISILQEGAVTVYSLNGSELTSGDGDVWKLTEQETQALYSRLGLPTQ